MYPARVHSLGLGLSFQRWDDNLVVWLLSGLYKDIEIKLKCTLQNLECAEKARSSNSNSARTIELHVIKMGRGVRNLISLKAGVSSRSRLFVWSIAAAFWYLSEFICRLSKINLLTYFGSTYLCEEAFSQIKIIKSRYRWTFKILPSFVPNYEPYISKLSQHMQCYSSTSQ